MPNIIIDESLVHLLVSTQFPMWGTLPITAVKRQGWDNRTFHLGEDLLVRLPSHSDYALQVEKEHEWLPKLTPFLPLPIPIPLAIGEPTDIYPRKWSIYAFLPGDSANNSTITNMNEFALDLANFLTALQKIDTTNGPKAGLHSFYRGGNLATYDLETCQAIAALKNRIDVKTISDIWQLALSSTWQNKAVWVHGDISTGNLLVKNGKLSAVIDFGQLAIGDPACDLSIAWNFFQGESRAAFHSSLSLDENTWARARGWALWKALIMASGQIKNNAVTAKEPWQIIDEIIAEYKNAY